MGRSSLWAAMAAFFVSCANQRVPFEEPMGLQVLALGGYRESDARVSHDQPMLGLEVMTTDPASQGWGFELGARYSKDDGNVHGLNRDSEFEEVSLGLRQTYHTYERARPFLGIGAAWMRTDHAQDKPVGTEDFDDRGFGGYLHTGLLWSLSQDELGRADGLLVGFDVRGLLGDDLDYLEVALVCGFGLYRSYD